jgi:hypothetical protein
MNRTLILAIMSSLLYQLSYNLLNADKGLEPIYIGHEPIMLPLHQPAFFILIVKYNYLIIKYNDL